MSGVTPVLVEAMKVFSFLTGFFIVCQASENLPIEDLDINSETAILRNNCIRFNNSSQFEKVFTVQTLNVVENWDLLVQIQECKWIIRNHFDVIFHPTLTFESGSLFFQDSCLLNLLKKGNIFGKHLMI